MVVPIRQSCDALRLACGVLKMDATGDRIPRICGQDPYLDWTRLLLSSRDADNAKQRYEHQTRPGHSPDHPASPEGSMFYRELKVKRHRRQSYWPPAKVIVCLANSSLGLGLPSNSWETNFQVPWIFFRTSLPLSQRRGGLARLVAGWPAHRVPCYPGPALASPRDGPRRGERPATYRRPLRRWINASRP